MIETSTAASGTSAPHHTQPPPPPSPAPTPPPERGVITLIREIQSGGLAGRNLSSEDRRRCVEHLIAEGYSTVETAEILGVAERTIARDRAAIRAANAVDVDPDLAPQVVGQLFRHAEQSNARLRRLSRERDCPAAVRVDAERVNWLILSDLVRTLQRLGWLPTAAQQIRADLTHRTDDCLPVDQLEHLLEEAARVESIARAAGLDQRLTIDLGHIREVTARHALAARIADVEAASESKETNHENR